MLNNGGRFLDASDAVQRGKADGAKEAAGAWWSKARGSSEWMARNAAEMVGPHGSFRCYARIARASCRGSKRWLSHLYTLSFRAQELVALRRAMARV